MGRQKEQQQKKLQSKNNNNNNNKREELEAECVKVCYFEQKPLGFQINESPDSIFVTNVYKDRGSAYVKGIKKEWRIVSVNEQNGVKEMMTKLRSSNGPFDIKFDCNQDFI